MKSEGFAALLAKLEELGFFRYVEPGQLEAVRAEALYDQFVFAPDAGRSFFADQESLAEVGVVDFLKEIAPFLHKQGVTLKAENEESDGYDYSVIVNGRLFEMYSRDELKHTEENGVGDNDIWALTTARAFRMVNAFLREAGSNERLYSLDGWNQMIAVFLTPEMFRLIDESDVIEERAKPEAYDDTP